MCIRDSLTIYNNNFTLEHALWMRETYLNGNFKANFPFNFAGGIPVDRNKSSSLVDQLSLKIKNEDEFNWSKLIPNDDFSALCLTSFIFHYKGVSTFEVFDNFY